MERAGWVGVQAGIESGWARCRLDMVIVCICAINALHRLVSFPPPIVCLPPPSPSSPVRVSSPAHRSSPTSP